MLFRSPISFSAHFNQRNVDRRINRQSQFIRRDKTEEQGLPEPPRKPHNPLDTEPFEADTVFLYMLLVAMNPVAYLPQSQRLLDQLREVLRYRHYSLKTEQAYLFWVRFFVRWHGRDGKMRHPRSIGAPEIEAFLTASAT